MLKPIALSAGLARALKKNDLFRLPFPGEENGLIDRLETVIEHWTATMKAHGRIARGSNPAIMPTLRSKR